METKRLTMSITENLQEDLELEDQVLTIMSTWKPSHIGVPLACNLLSIDLQFEWLACHDSTIIRWPCKYIDFGLACMPSFGHS